MQQPFIAKPFQKLVGVLGSLLGEQPLISYLCGTQGSKYHSFDNLPHVQSYKFSPHKVIT